MTDFNLVVDALADLIAERVVQRLNRQTGADWPGPLEAKVAIENPVDTSPPWNPEEAPTRTIDRVVEKEPETDSKAERQAYWNATVKKKGREYVNNLLREFGEDLRGYSRIKKNADFVNRVVDLEILTGKHIDDVQVIVEPEVEDEEIPELTRETALAMDIADLRQLAISQGIDEAHLKGKDVDSIADLLLGEEVEPESGEDTTDVEEGNDDGDLIELDPDEVRAMSIAELKDLATEFGIEYTRTTSRDDLIVAILEDE